MMRSEYICQVVSSCMPGGQSFVPFGKKRGPEPLQRECGPGYGGRNRSCRISDPLLWAVPPLWLHHRFAESSLAPMELREVQDTLPLMPTLTADRIGALRAQFRQSMEYRESRALLWFAMSSTYTASSVENNVYWVDSTMPLRERTLHGWMRGAKSTLSAWRSHGSMAGIAPSYSTTKW